MSEEEDGTPQAQTTTTRLSQDELQALLETSRREIERIDTYGGDRQGALICLLLVDYLLLQREQNQLLADILARGKQA
jgi:hypothetical protein